jgi:hypothetical protein
MTCKCEGRPSAFFIDEAPPGFEQDLRREDFANWMTLYSCPVCGSLWAIDVYEKLESQVVFRVLSKENWANDLRTAERKALLLKSRGGVTDEECLWEGCSNKQLKGVVFCLDHLYAMGHRRTR